MTIVKPTILAPLVLAPGENSSVQVHKDLNGGCTLMVIDGDHPKGFPIRFSPHNTIGIALAMLEAVGVPVQTVREAYRAQLRGKP